MKKRRPQADPSNLLFAKKETADTLSRGSFLNAVRLDRESVPNFEKYPFAVPAIRYLHRLEFHPAIT